MPGTDYVSKQRNLGGALGIGLLLFALAWRFFPGVLHVVPQEQMQALMGIACPQIVYPYLRANVADVVTRAGFPPVHMAEINFQAMFEQQQAEQQAQQADAPSQIITSA